MWQLQEARQKFSELVDRTVAEGPQEVTRRGERAVVMLSAGEYDRLTGRTRSFKDVLLGPPYIDESLEIHRETSLTRDVELG